MPKDFEKRIEEKIDRFAAATERGFKEVDKKIDAFAAATEKEFEGMAIMVQRGFEETASKTELGEVKTELVEVKIRLDRIENILLRDHNNRIERIEDKLMQVEVILGQRLKP